MRALPLPPTLATIGAATILALAAALLYFSGQGVGGDIPPVSAAICDADNGPAVVTDRVEYLPTEVAVIEGCGFEAYNGQTLTIRVTEPDSVEFTDNVSIDDGTFAYSYVIPDKQGTYVVAVLNGASVLASTTFLDSHYADPTTLTFVVEQGSSPASQNFTVVATTACDDAGATVSDDQSWISTSGNWATGAWLAGPGSGNVHVDRTVSISSGSLAIGTYTGTVTIDLLDSSSGCNGNLSVTIRLYVVRPNPTLPASCGLDVGLVIDSSGSIDSTELAQMKSAFQSFVNAFLPDTPTQMSVVDFDDVATALGSGAWSNNATTVNGWVNTPTSGGRTNWDDAINDSNALFPNRAGVPDLMILASDGNPNNWGGNDGDPVTQDSGGLTALQKAIDEANVAKAAGIRIITLGIGNDLTTAHLAAISSWDAVYTSNFSTLADTLADLAVQMCGGTVTAKKLLDLDNNLATTGDQVPAAGWTMTTNVNSPDTSTPTSGLTDSGGQINFDINLGGDGTATLSVTETMQAGYVFMSASCKKGATPLGTPGSGTVTGVVIGPQDIVACTFINLPQRSFTVNKDFVPNSGASVTVSLSCATGTSSPASASVTESAPATFTVTGYTGNPNCTATESPIPSGYESTGTCAATLTTGSCTITNTRRSGTFTINKDFVPNSGSSVPVGVSCTSGTPSPASGSFSESSPLVVTVTGFNAGATCTATETVPSGYTANQANCANKTLVNGGNVSCTITNTLNAGTFIVNKDFVPNAGGSVSVSVSCTSGTPSPASGSASEATPFTTTVSGYSGSPTCTATESPVPTGYNSTGTCSALLSAGQCTITNTLNSATLTVYKDFVPNNAASVSVSVTCTTGTPSPASGSSSEATPFATTVTGFTTGATCTATETVPSGYTANQTNCANVAVSHGGTHSCTIVNTLNQNAFVVNKDFVPNSGASVSVSISCASGTPVPSSGTASEASPFNTVVSGYTGNPTCTATESPVPTGYTSSGTCNATITVGACTIANTLNTATFTVNKDFVPNSGASVSVSITCTSGTPSPASGSASEATPFTATVTGYSTGASCTATESIPSGYTSTGTCTGSITGAPSGTGSCTIVNTLKSGTFTVNKDFVPNNAGSVSVSVTCTSGTPSPASGASSEATPFVTTVTGFATGATCTATETVPAGYTANQAGCAGITLVNGSNVSCTITNTLNSATFTVNKDFVPNSGASVSVSITCTSGTPSPASGSASEATPFTTTVSGYTPGASCTATESIPAGYVSSGTCSGTISGAPSGSGSCTIVNTQTNATLKVSKDFVPNSGATVSVSVTCTSGTPSPASGTASEAVQFTTIITGFTAGAMCSVTESPVPTGYTASLANCTNVAISNGGTSTCTVTNTLNSATLTVNKDFVPNSGASVSVSVSCTSGTPSPASGSSSEATPFTTTITGFTTGATCTATETVPAGYAANQAGCASVAITNGGSASCTIVNTLRTGAFTVNKDFVPNSGASVSVSVSCTSGTPSPASGSASEATPFVTTVTGFSVGASCTATETVPAGYTANQAGCVSVVLNNGGNVSCTITNTLNTATLTVNKDFSPNSGASVSVSVTCTTGSASPASGSASEATPFVTTISGFSAGATCTATETVPSGYTANQTNCASVAISIGGSHSCTITNTLNNATLTVNKDFVPNSGASVSVSVTCTSGTPTPASGTASESTPFVTQITGFIIGATCTATETVPTGYTANQLGCALVLITNLMSSSCTITNTLNSATLTVNKDFIPNDGASVPVSVSCTSGTPSPASGSFSESTPFVTTITGFTVGTTCTATETVPGGYTANQLNCALVLILVNGTHSCTIVNTQNSASFVVAKDFIPNSLAIVNVSISCASGTASPSSGVASEALPFTTTVSGYSGDPLCTATESPIPTGYSSSGTCAAALSAGTCTITNTLNSATLTVNKDFVPNDGASVAVLVTCTTGTPSPAAGTASEATPFTTTITGFSVGATCTATETPPLGYTANQSNCASVPISVGGSSSCTIVNTLNSATLTVNKDFVPNSGASVPVSVTCTSGTPSPASGTASEATPFVTTITGFTVGTTCTATETVPTGYTDNQAGCVLVVITVSGSASCTITNTLNSATLTVNKDFQPNSGASVPVSVTCTSGTPSPASGTASEATPFVTTITGFTVGTTCTATETVPGGYTDIQAGCALVLITVGGSASCTIINVQTSAPFTVNKDFVPNDGASVSVSVSCASGLAIPASGTASEATPFSTTVVGFVGDPLCTATESPIPTGYSSSGTCNANLSAGNCTITNTLNTATLTVNKDFQPNSGASVNVSVSCSSGTPSPASGTASEATPFVTTVSGFTVGATCTATESPVPTGYTDNQSGCASVAISVGGSHSCTIVNVQNSGVFTVSKDFQPNSGASVSVSVSCTSGTPSPASGSASEATPFTTTVSGFTPGASCTATESPIPPGYNSSGTCTGTIASGGCTIVNTLIQLPFTVQKDFVPNSGASVTVMLSCASGTASPASASASEATPASFTVSGPVGNPSCTATETPIPSGYNSSATCNAPLSTGTCTITNTLRSTTLTVNKDFQPDSGASVPISVTCTSGSASPSSGSASESTPFVTTISGFNVGATCTATETIPGGYNANQANCANVAVSDGVPATCTIVNTAQAMFTVSKDFSDNNPATVTVTLNCSQGTPSPASAPASESSPATFLVTGANPGTTCNANEAGLPPNYVSTPCSATMSVGSCTIVNNAVASFTVAKDFVPNNAQSVQIGATCSSGVVSPPNATISEGNPWTFTVTGYQAGATCTGIESPVPAGYISTGNCTAVIVSFTASCTIVNTLGTPSPTPSPGPTQLPGSTTPTPNTAVGGNVVLPVGGGESGGDCCTSLFVIVLVGLVGVVSAGGALAFSRRIQS